VARLGQQPAVLQREAPGGRVEEEQRDQPVEARAMEQRDDQQRAAGERGQLP
jgi:hypothetical protein